jgi:uncharacterized protein (DUF2249 family)
LQQLIMIKAIGLAWRHTVAMNFQPPLELDVRPLFAAGRPPLSAILNAVNRLQPGQALRLIAPMQPEPLYQLLGERGFTPEAREREDGAWEILFRPAEES